jgi:hypothetical protein
MTKDDMIRLARKAGLWSKYGAVMMNDDVAFVHAQTGDWPELQAFADLCAAETSTVQPSAARYFGMDFGGPDMTVRRCASCSHQWTDDTVWCPECKASKPSGVV